MTTLIIGRAKDADISISDATVSRRHAELAIAPDGKMVLSDQDSTGGTYLLIGNGWRRISSTPVTAADRVRFAGHETTVEEILAQAGQKSPSGRRKRYERDPETGEIIVRVE